MAEFKLTIADPKSGKSYKKEVKDADAAPFIGLNIGETVKGEAIGLTGYEFKITGGSDYCGFPMRHGILGIRKRILLYGGVGYSGKMRPLRKGKKKRQQKGLQKRKTVCGHKINENINQINLSVSKEGSKKLADALGGEAPKKEAAEKPKEAPKKEAAEKPAEKPKEAKPEPKAEEKKEAPKEEKPKEAPKEEAKKE